MAMPWDRIVICDACGARNRVITHYAYGPAEETDTGECIRCRSEIVREKCGYIEVKEPDAEEEPSSS